MKSFVQFYLILPAIFLLLTLLQAEAQTVRDYIITIAGGLAVGMFVGFIIHMATLLGKKIKKNTPT